MGGSEEAKTPAPAAAPKAPLLKRVIGGGLSKIGSILILQRSQACLFVLGACWALLHQWFCASTGELKMRGVYFSEAALLSEHSKIAFDTADARLAVDLSHTYSTLPTTTGAGGRLAWIREQLHIADPGRIRTYVQTFQARPVQAGGDSELRTNLYGVLEPRVGTTRNEAIVIMAKHLAYQDTSGNEEHLGDNADKASAGGLSLVISLARHFARQKYLSKRVIFVFCDGGSDPHGWDGGMDLGAREWIRAYVDGEIATAGQIRAAVILDMQRGDDMSELGVAMHGNNGLLSNLDLVNVLTMGRKYVRTRNAPIVAVSRLRPRGHPWDARLPLQGLVRECLAWTSAWLARKAQWASAQVP